LNQKTLPSEQGQAAFSFANVAQTIPVFNQDIGSITYGYRFNLVEPDPTHDIDLFPLSNPPGAYTPAGGQAAWSSLVGFMQDPKFVSKNNMPVATSEKTRFLADASALQC